MLIYRVICNNVCRSQFVNDDFAANRRRFDENAEQICSLYKNIYCSSRNFLFGTEQIETNRYLHVFPRPF